MYGYCMFQTYELFYFTIKAYISMNFGYTLVLPLTLHFGS